MQHPDPHTNFSLRTQVMAVPYKPRAPLFVAIALFLVLSLLILFIFVPQVFAEPLAPEAPGSIAGVIKTADGTPQVDIQVTLYKSSIYYTNYWEPLRSITTQADGQYRFTLLPTGLYRVGVSDAQKVFAPLYYPATPTLQKAADIAVAGNQISGIDLTLQLGGQISGMVTATSNVTITGGYVELRQAMEQQGASYWQTIQMVLLPLNGGVYTFTALSADSYRVCANAYYMTLSTYECYDNVYDVNRATPLTLTAGATISNVNIVLGDGADYAQLRGSVTSLNHEPLSGIDVYAIPAPLPDPAVVQATAQPVPTPTPAAPLPLPVIPVAPLVPVPLLPHYEYYGYWSARTDSQGNYHLATLPGGRYRLYFRDPAGDYAFQYYHDTILAGEANLIEIAPQQVISDINVQLGPGSHLTGVITVLDQLAVNAYVNIERKTANGWTYITTSTADPNTGRYAIGGLPAGVYRLFAYAYIPEAYTIYYYQGYWGGDTPDTAAEISLGTSETKQADFALTGGPQFDGSVNGRVTANGSPLAGARVSLYRQDYSCCSPLLQPTVYVFTDGEGRYAINGLTNSTFRLGVTDPTGIYATTYYTAQAVPAFANTISVEDTKALTDIDVDLPLAGAISGRITRRSGEPVAGLLVSIYLPASPFSSFQLIAADTTTDADGRYTVKGLHAGEYFICFSQSLSGYSECYGTADWGYGGIGGLSVKVVAGETKTDVDLLWGSDLHNYLPIIAQ